MTKFNTWSCGKKCNPLIRFTDDGREANRTVSKAKDRLYVTSSDPGVLFTVQLYVQTYAPIALGPNVLLVRPPPTPPL